jgi:regulatory protein
MAVCFKMDHKITALTPQKRNHQRINVYLDGEFAFGLERIVAAWLEVGQNISDEKVAHLQAEEARETAYQKALNFLSYRPRTEAEIRRNLQGHAILEEDIAFAIERLKRSGLVDDVQFTRVWIDNRNEMRPRGRRALAFELSQRGVDRQTIDEALSTLDEEGLAYQAAINQARKFKELNSRDFHLKMYRYLAQRGFNHEAISEAISRVWAKIHGSDDSLEEEAYL